MFEKGPEKSERGYSEIAKKVFIKFEARSDDPGEFLSEEEKDNLQKATRINPDALRKWEEDRNSKYRVNSLYSPLLVSENFLKSSEAKIVPDEIKKNLVGRVDKAYADLENSRGKRIQKNLVEEIEGIVNEVKKYI